MSRRTLCVLILAFFLFLSAVCHAEDGYDAQLFRPSIFGGNFVAIEDAQTLCPLGFGGGLLMNYANGPVEIRVDDGDDIGVVNQLLTADFLGAFAPLPWLSLGVDVPVHLMARGRQLRSVENSADMTGLANETRFGDIRAEFKFGILRQDKHWINFAAAPWLTFPTGDETRFLGEGRITAGGTAMLEHDFEIVNAVINLGYQYRGDRDISQINVGDAWKFGAGLSRNFGDFLSASVEYYGTWYDSGSQDRFQSNPMEILATVRWKFGAGPRVIGGAGPGLTSGVGSPAYRILAGADWYYCPPQKPKYTHGLLSIRTVDDEGNAVKAKLEIAGAMDLHEETNAWGRFKADATPGLYNINAYKEGYVPASVKTSVELGMTTEVDLVLKRIPTLLTVHVNDKFSGAPLSGKITFDNNWDDESSIMTFENGTRTKEFEPGEYEMVVDVPGYETGFTHVKVIKGEETIKQIKLRKKIEKIGKIYFAFDSSELLPQSYPVLNDVVKKISQLGDYKRIVVEGHCSNEGSDEYNMKLSKARALSVVNYLVDKGIPTDKLEIVPYGESRPIATNETEEGRAKNRRVEFIIEE